MPDITITIPLPVLTTGQVFKTRYRSLPSGPWSSYVNRTNVPFTLTGLSVGNYQLEVILQKADGTLCPAVYETFTVVDEFECISFDAEIMQQSSLYYLEISYTLPVGFTDPACGWEISYQQNGNTTTVPYQNLPLSGQIKLQVLNMGLFLTIRANLCNGNRKVCMTADVSGFPSPPCTPVTITGSEILIQQNKFYVSFTFTQSTPASSTLYIAYNQVYPILMTPPPDMGIIPAYPTPAGVNKVTFQVNPKNLQQLSLIKYSIYVQDSCYKTQFDVTKPW